MDNNSSVIPVPFDTNSTNTPFSLNNFTHSGNRLTKVGSPPLIETYFIPLDINFFAILITLLSSIFSLFPNAEALQNIQCKLQ